MIWRIDIWSEKNNADQILEEQIRDLGDYQNISVSHRKVYLIETDITKEKIEELICHLLVDPIYEKYSLQKGIFLTPPLDNEILITYLPAVTDTVANSLLRASRQEGYDIINARTARFYSFSGLLKEEINSLARRLLYNPLIEYIINYQEAKKINSLVDYEKCKYVFKLNVVPILNLDFQQLSEISRQGNLSLNGEEMVYIQKYFQKLGRDPTDCELETIAQTWSEHCAHKTFKGNIFYQEVDEQGNILKEEKIENMFSSFLKKATEKINHPDCVSVFVDNAGIVRFNEKYNLCFKVETHNHPSSLEPFGGAATGIGGVIRDILGTGLAAKPVASIDVFCFSPWQIDYKSLPVSLLHPRRIIKGVVSGVKDYGNKMGIPTIAGAVYFDERFLGNPLVYCGTVGILPKEKSFKKVEPEDIIVVCGARTGRDGIHGATFSSIELKEETLTLHSAVQIGNPIEEKKVTEAILRAQREDLFNAITDCGAGGLSSAIGELAKDYGAEVWLDKVPLKYEGLSYTEIWISESQERMVFFTKEHNLPRLREIFQEEGSELAVIGKVKNNKRLKLFYKNELVCDLDMDFLHKVPLIEKKAIWIKKNEEQAICEDKEDYSQDVLSLLARPTIASKEWIVRQYDHEVQGQSVKKAFEEIDKINVSDAAVIRPDFDSDKCVAVGVGINPAYSDIDPYWMAALSIEEALRNILSVGGSLAKTFILDNFSWGSPDDPYQLGALTRAVRACYDFSCYFGVPFISGKDSLYNEYVVAGKRVVIPGTLLISAISILDKPEDTLSNNFLKEKNLIYLIGNTESHLGKSEYFNIQGIKKGFIPKIDTKIALNIMRALEKAIKKNIVLSCHDCSEGGLAVALAEMCFSSRLGANIFLGEVASSQQLSDWELLFSESPTRFIVEVSPTDKKYFEEIFVNLPYGLIGCVDNTDNLVIYSKTGKSIVQLSNEELITAWRNPFNEFMYK